MTRFLLIGLLLCAGCGGFVSGSKTLQGGEITVAYSLNPETGNLGYSIGSRTCGVVTQGTAHVEPAIAACMAVKGATTLVGTVQTPSTPVAP
jgi:hypothetical protein